MVNEGSLKCLNCVNFENEVYDPKTESFQQSFTDGICVYHGEYINEEFVANLEGGCVAYKKYESMEDDLDNRAYLLRNFNSSNIDEITQSYLDGKAF